MGYNCSDGGSQQSIGENNGRALLTENDIVFIRTAYSKHKSQKEIYQNYFKNRTTFSNFQAIWQGRTWTHIMPEVYSEENKKYYMYENSLGSKSSKAVLTDKDVITARQRYVNENAKIIYEDYKDKLKYQTFQDMLWGRTYKNLPIYKKKEKKWINV
jgi:hypothetical protein